MFGECEKPIDVSLQLAYFSSLRVRLFFCLSFFCTEKVEVMREVSGIVSVLKKPGGRKNTHSIFVGFFLFRCAFHVRTEQSGRKGG